MDFNEGFGGRYGNRYEDAYGDYRGGYAPGPFPPSPPPPPPPRPLFGPPPAFLAEPGPGPNPMFLPPRPDHPAIRYLMKCGLPRNSLRAFPKNLLDLIEPQYCGLCGVNFDTFAISRVHYLSKNHTKTQKKFLSQNNVRNLNQKETPLKSRELYCELCDVEITSKAHADSHYAGRPHLAVVEGRKNPKNPILLQPGMERRLQQLIRREKKALASKPLEIKDAEDSKKDVKPLIPELYCDICKTSVTCSEQMTTHLNGKRHLNKEKQNILRTIRGEVGYDGDYAESKEEGFKNEPDNYDPDAVDPMLF